VVVAWRGHGWVSRALHSAREHYWQPTTSREREHPTMMAAAAREPADKELLLLTELNLYCVSGSFSEIGLKEIIQRNGFTPNKDKCCILSSYTFFFRACSDEKLADGRIDLLLEYFPKASEELVDDGEQHLPLHIACQNKNVTPKIVRVLIDAYPPALTTANINGYTVLHHLSANTGLDNEVAMAILTQIPDNHLTQLVNSPDRNGLLPIHLASGRGRKSPKFCECLIRVHPDSVGTTSNFGALPLHHASLRGTTATAKYLCKLFPDGVNHYSTPLYGQPIHLAIRRLMRSREEAETAAEIIKVLLSCKSYQKHDNSLKLLLWASIGRYNASNLDSALQAIEILYETYPEAIKTSNMVARILTPEKYHETVTRFLYHQLIFVLQDDRKCMYSKPPDIYGRLPIHYAVTDNSVALGSIMLLVESNPSVLKAQDFHGLIPLHLACQHRFSTAVIQYLIDTDESTLNITDSKGNAAFHHACRSANCEAINLMLRKEKEGTKDEKYRYSVPISKANYDKELCIQLFLFKSDRNGEESTNTKYTESLFKLIRACPVTALKCGMQQQCTSAIICSSQKGTKRKLGRTLSEALVISNENENQLNQLGAGGVDDDKGGGLSSC